jgi:hypothetical protein
MDFSRATFENQALDIYDEFRDAVKSRNKLELMKLCSYPMYEVIEISKILKDGHEKFE